MDEPHLPFVLLKPFSCTKFHEYLLSARLFFFVKLSPVDGGALANVYTGNGGLVIFIFIFVILFL